MKTNYVYLVYEDCHGLIGVYGSPEGATERVIAEAKDGFCCECLPAPDFDDDYYYGWDVVYWRRVEVQP